MRFDSANLKYALQACVNLEAEFAARGDKESVAHFRRRQREITRQLSKHTK